MQFKSETITFDKRKIDLGQDEKYFKIVFKMNQSYWKILGKMLRFSNENFVAKNFEWTYHSERVHWGEN